MNAEALRQAKEAYAIEAECIREELEVFDDEQFGRAVDALAKAPRIGSTGCGHSGIICQHFAHLMCCIERPARFIRIHIPYCRVDLLLIRLVRKSGIAAVA